MWLDRIPLWFLVIVAFYMLLAPFTPMPHVLEKMIMPNPDISRVECTHIQGIRAADVVVYLNALITQKMGALGSPEG